MAIKAKKVQPAKIAAIAEAKAVLESYSDYIFTNYRGLTVDQITALRGKLREKDAAFKVLKNNFARVAFADMKIDTVSDYLKGPTAIALGKEDMNEIAKILVDFQKEAPALELKAGLIDNEVYDLEKLIAFSKLPGRKQLMAMIAMTVNAPVQKLAATLQAAVDKRTSEGAGDGDKLYLAEAPAKEALAKEAPAEETPVAESKKEETPKVEEKPAE
ncbi:MAG: 50S ribosomal protein L10 [Treponema sp. CETP13]|nr:MAG: 50S ribosomal protein L10 [Treponema sp. CETP13]